MWAILFRGLLKLASLLARLEAGFDEGKSSCDSARLVLFPLRWGVLSLTETMGSCPPSQSCFSVDIYLARSAALDCLSFQRV